MKISVIIPTYNRASFLKRCLESLLSQTHQANEIIVIDDGSFDNTQEVLKSFEAFGLVYCYQKNKGVSCARNVGIGLAKNEWLAFLDSDDVWHEKKLELQVLFHTQNPTILASYTDELWVRNNQIITPKSHLTKEIPTFLNSLRRCKIGASTFFCHKDIFAGVGVFDETLQACEDYDMWLRILLHFDIAFIPEKLTTKYAGHENQLSFTTMLLDTFRVNALKKHLNSSYHTAVYEELVYKITLLLKGASRHDNKSLQRAYEKELQTLLQMGLKNS